MSVPQKLCLTLISLHLHYSESFLQCKVHFWLGEDPNFNCSGFFCYFGVILRVSLSVNTTSTVIWWKFFSNMKQYLHSHFQWFYYIIKSIPPQFTLHKSLDRALQKISLASSYFPQFHWICFVCNLCVIV